MTRLLPLIILLAASGGLAPAFAQRPLDHDDYEIWRSIDGEMLSRDGRWVAYALTRERADTELRVRSTVDTVEYVVPRGRDPRFSPDASHVVFTIAPSRDSVRAAKRAGKKDDDLPQDSLGMLDLRSGAITRVARVRSFGVPADAGAWLAYHLLREPASDDSAAVDSAAAAPDSAASEPKKDEDVGTTLVLHRLGTGLEARYEHVTAYQFAEDGSRLLATLSSKDGDADGVILVRLGDGADSMRIAAGRGTYTSPVFSKDARQAAFLSDRDEADQDHPRFALYRWRAGDQQARVAARAGMRGMPDGWSVSEHRAPAFSPTGSRLLFGSAPWSAPLPDDSTLEEDRVVVDLWHWQDPLLMPQQLEQAEDERQRSYRAVVQLDAGRIVQLGTPDMRDVHLVRDGDGDWAIGEAESPYAQRISWDFPPWRDVYLIDVRSGERSLLLRETQGTPRLSPAEHYVAWWDNAARAWRVRSRRSGRTVDVTAALPPVHNEDHDWPYPPSAYGLGGWTADDEYLLIYDRYDVWAVDPEGRTAPRNITDGVGRRDSLRLRVVDLDPEEDAIDPHAPLLLSAFNYRDKREGFYRDLVAGHAAPERLLLMEHNFSTPRKADDADVLLFTRESVGEFPDLWVSGLDLADARRVSDANPQQTEYNWATVDLVEWRSTDGTPLQGLLYRPADFDPARTYPMIVYFYERNSDNLYRHYPPYAHRSVIRPTFYASRGYVVFIPDIVYRVGYPGQSALDAVIPGVHEVLRGGFVDPARIGVQGHSWGGYQIAYMVTRTNIFRAAAAGAPVANMTSAYGGIRWGSGLSRMFQYERTQSRIGGSLWETPLRYVENPPVFWADRVETPLLMMHNDQDGAVPWEQGIEMFVALRRLGKPAWLVNYNGEPHWPLPFPKRRDWNVRLQQFLDHYLQDAPPPEWLLHGVPATEKGRTLGLELVEEGR